MGKQLFYSSAFAIIMELFIIPVIRKMSVDSRWSPLTFAGALLFLVAIANIVHANDHLPQSLTSVYTLVVGLPAFFVFLQLKYHHIIMLCLLCCKTYIKQL